MSAIVCQLGNCSQDPHKIGDTCIRNACLARVWDWIPSQSQTHILCLRDFFLPRRNLFSFCKTPLHPTPVLLPGKSHGRRSLVGCSPWGREESDTTEQLHFHFSLSCIGEGNGNPLQCSCLDNPRDRGAWWAAVYEVTQSRTWLKWLSSRYHYQKESCETQS